MSDRPGPNLYETYLEHTYGPRNDLTTDGIARSAALYREWLAPLLPTDRDVAILELGCGAGALLVCLRDLGYRRFTGVDISPQQVEFCRDRGFEDVHCARASDFLADTTERFAAVVMSDVLEHMPKQEVLDVLSSVAGSLERGGQLIIKVPNLSNPLNLRTRYVDLTHETGFTRESLEQALRATGFEIVSIEGEWRPHRRWLRRWVFDRLLWRAFCVFHRHTLHLKAKPIRGKNLIAVGRRPGA